MIPEVGGLTRLRDGDAAVVILTINQLNKTKKRKMRRRNPRHSPALLHDNDTAVDTSALGLFFLMEFITLWKMMPQREAKIDEDGGLDRPQLQANHHDDRCETRKPRPQHVWRADTLATAEHTRACGCFQVPIPSTALILQNTAGGTRVSQ